MPVKKASPFELRAEDRAPLSVLVSRQLRQAIVSGRVSAGTELPSEKELTEELGVGRSTIREALRILQAQGLLSGGDTVSTRRPRVSSQQALSLAAAQAMENVVRLGQVPLDDLVELRVVIEGASVDAAAAAVDDAALDAARAAVRAMKASARGTSPDVEAFRAADLAFHRSLASASRNAAFPLVMGVLRSAISSHLGEALHREPDAAAAIARLTREHEAILAAIEAGRGDRARALVTRHIRAFYRARAEASP
ncbi:MAG: FadR family transcriptional regulator [Labilithrix sp.]|nr:FadR family transcriptional regulator [Labilithrix sp.]